MSERERGGGGDVTVPIHTTKLNYWGLMGAIYIACQKDTAVLGQFSLLTVVNLSGHKMLRRYQQISSGRTITIITFR